MLHHLDYTPIDYNYKLVLREYSILTNIVQLLGDN